MPQSPAAIQEDDTSDYGGDFSPAELDILESLLANLSPSSGGDSFAEDQPLELTDIEDCADGQPTGVRLPKTLGKELWKPSAWTRNQRQQAHDADGHVTPAVKYQTARNGGSAETMASGSRSKVAAPERQRSATPGPQEQPDTRSPIARFRTKPKKALSVTDLISPAWCELQYFYNLSKHGKKRATPAMRQGTKVHKKLEDEVHTTVPVNITTREDSWGLRIWNVVQGLRTLRETGRTRELEVWGVIDGEIVNGVIDELSYECPNPELEEREARRLAETGEVKNETAEGQASITEYLLSPSGGNGKTFDRLGTGIEESMRPPLWTKPRSKTQEVGKKIYITDIKTRSFPTLPSTLVSRPTEIQLQLYHRMVTSLAQGDVPLSIFAERYGINPNATFSDSFIAQVGSLNETFFDAMSSQNSGKGNENDKDIFPASSQDSIDILLRHNSVASLWDLMISQFRETFLTNPPPAQKTFKIPPSETSSLFSSKPNPASSSTSLQPQPEPETRLSSLLTATYIHHSSSANQETHLGNKYFTCSPTALATYLASEMAWWRGERPARGVPIEEVGAKCMRCEFVAECEWVREREREVKASIAEGRRVSLV